MTREEQIEWLCRLKTDLNNGVIFTPWNKEFAEALTGVLEQEPCEDCISRENTLKAMIKQLGIRNEDYLLPAEATLYKVVKNMSPVTPQQKIGHCKDCKWWKDSDGHYRRGIRAESQCPMNREEVYKGNGYCFMYEPQGSEV